MIMQNKKGTPSPQHHRLSYLGVPDWFGRGVITTQVLPESSKNWISYINDDELVECFLIAAQSIYGHNFIEGVKEIGQDDTWLLFCGEFFDVIKDKVVEKQAYLVKKVNLEILNEEMKSEVDEYLKNKTINI